MPLLSADLDWDSAGTPLSRRFDDIYFSRENGLAESCHVYLQGCDLPARWQGRDHFAVGELGFGTGLNFLLTWQAWREDPLRSRQLDYVSVEGFPLDQNSLDQALQAFPSLAPLATSLTTAWPPHHPGHHLRLFDHGQVRLLLLFGEAGEVLPSLSARMDAWYLDGFAPSRNPDMWRPEVLQQVARLSAQDATLATFTAAGSVRRALADLGFSVHKRPGFGRKRDCTHAVFRPEAVPDETVLAATVQTETRQEETARDRADSRSPPTRKRPQAGTPPPWFAPPAPLPAGSRLAVIGGGIAGCAVAAALHRQGFSVHLFERHSSLAREGSGNPCGLLKPRLTADGGLHGRFYSQATLYAQSLLPAEAWVGRGILHLARDETEAATQARLAHTLPPGHAEVLEAPRASALCGEAAPFGGLWFPHAGSIRPREVCRLLLGKGVTVSTESSLPSLTPPLAGSGEPWLVAGDTFSGVVVTAGPWSAALWPAAELPLYCNRGYISLYPADTPLPESGVPPALSFGGYLSPPFADRENDTGGLRVLGATYDRLCTPADILSRPEWQPAGWPQDREAAKGHGPGSSWRQERPDDRQRVRDVLAAALPQTLASLPQSPREGRVAVRATIADHMPVAGPLFVASDLREAYAGLHHGRRPHSYPPAPWVSGLYTLCGLGSRGFQTAPLLAEYLAAMIAGTPSPLPADMAEAVHPARFQVRQLKKKPSAGR